MQDQNNIDDPTLKGPNLMFSDNLPFIDDEFTAYFWTKNPLGDRIDEPVDRNDHAMDAIKYMLSRLPDPTELVFNQPMPTPEYLKWHEPR